ncbi:hypothetical protein FJM67_12455 [Maribrevibacterium harenarium]|uniref:ParB/Sulfiredoxin domain-containing protein n=1 Tax=Maribrevibacterium harenarium TaxID=2589817 RepID=A0A501WJQ4_9GAMM|nr:hypothetical protein [Maribrevibacterium harenarium]TPE49002.1 hypothetical protein FJM67_12455 [Maribrevibacterium harenarium]
MALKKRRTVPEDLKKFMDSDFGEDNAPKARPINQSSTYLQAAELAYDSLKKNGGSIPPTTFTNDDGTVVKLTPEFIEIPFSELEEKTLISNLNPRLWIETEYNDLTLSDQIETAGIRNLSAGYMLDGDSCISIANGGTRRNIAISLYRRKGINKTYPLVYYRITAENLWVVRQLVDDSEYGRKFNTIENALRLRAVYEAQVDPNLSDLMRAFDLATGNSISRPYCKQLLLFSLFLPYISPYFLRHFSRSEDITAKIMGLVFEFVTGHKMSTLDLSDPNNRTPYNIRHDLDRHIKSLVIDEKVLELDKLLSNGNKHRVTITKLLTERLSPKKIDDAPKQESNEQGILSGQTHVGFSLSYSREDYDSDEIAVIRSVIERHKEQLLELQRIIDKEIAQALTQT